jgi:prophage regulatory protein
MNKLPQTGYLRIWQILGSIKTSPPTPPLIPISKSTWWEGVKTGRFPKPIKLGPRTTVWRVEEIIELIEKGGRGGNSHGS